VTRLAWFACAVLACGVVACADETPRIQAGSAPTLGLTVEAAAISTVLPGTRLALSGTGFLSGITLEALVVGTIDGEPIELRLSAERIDDVTVGVNFLPEVMQSAPQGTLTGVLTLQGRLGEAVGRVETGLVTEVRHTLVPELERVAAGVFPTSPVEVRGGGLLTGPEGLTLIELEGTYVRERDGQSIRLSVPGVVVAPDDPRGWLRDRAYFAYDPAWVGHEPGSIEAEVRLINEGIGWRAESLPVTVRFDVLPPTVARLSTVRASRGEAVRITGDGFLGGASGGFTILRLDGDFTGPDGTVTNLGPGLELSPSWEGGQSLVFTMRVNYDFACASSDLGATPGVLEGGITPSTTYEGVTVQGARLPLNFEILATKQVVFLRFLPSFTEQLRAFGLRNVSSAVRDRIVAVVERDYEGINLEVRLSQPTDFIEYSTVEIGGPDPNGQNLFGLDNTTGLDHCNERLDDLLAGRNADSNDAYGGIFIESFIQLSEKRGLGNELSRAPMPTDGDPDRTAGQIFDQIFDPVITQEVTPGEFPGGPRHAAIDRAIRTMGNLVGNTVTHEIGHSLGLPKAPGCGQYHNAPGPRQIMDCGVDRPFSERAELEAGDHGIWTPENRAYLEETLPIE
jgi:hypothetical protein